MTWSAAILAPLALLVSLSLSQAAPSTPCNDTQFTCHSTDVPCIPLEWMCDHHPDCPGGKDEVHCAYLHECSSGQMMCRNGECVSARFKCDGAVDCSDKTDEKHCREFEEINQALGLKPGSSHSTPFASTHSSVHAPESCGRNEYRCQEAQCIVKSAVCDGTWDCPMGDDEERCKPTSSSSSDSKDDDKTPHLPFPVRVEKCQEGHTSCADHWACVPDAWVCDGVADCNDESDEAHCEHEDKEQFEDMLASVDHLVKQNESDDTPSMTEYLHGLHEALCTDKQFRCRGGHCIDMTLACNGHPDCPNGDDETDRCQECSRKATECTHHCKETPRGHVCECPHGMSLHDDSHTCEDVDECRHEGRRCSQFCENRRDGYECTCAPGYTLSSDRHTCHLDSANSLQGTIHVSLTAEIRSMPLFSPQASTEGYETWLSTHGYGTAKSLSLDVAEQKMFMGVHNLDKRGGQLAMAHDGHTHVLREAVQGIHYVAVDWVGENVLYTARHPSPNPGIYLCAQSGLFCKRIIAGKTEGKHFQAYRGLAVNSVRGLVAWVDILGGDHRILVANLDGTNMRTLIEHKVDYPTTVAFDPIKNDVYFADVERELIEKVNVDTLDRSVVLSAGVHHPSAMAFFNGFLFWTDWGTETLKVSSLGLAHSSPHLIHSFSVFPYSIAVNHTRFQPVPAENPCELVSCPWMCVVVAVNGLDTREGMEAKCVCPEDYEENPDYDPEIDGSLPCVHTATESEVDDKTPHVSVEMMQEYCQLGKACLHGGKCVEHPNESGRVQRITCECAEGYTGASCEIGKPGTITSGKDEESDRDGQGSSFSFGFGVFIVCLLIVLACGGMIFYGRKQSDRIAQISRSTMHKVQEARLPERAAAAIQRGVNKARSPRPMAQSTSFTARSEPDPTSAPMPRSASDVSSSSTAAFNNPAFDLHNTAVPYSGLSDMNSTVVVEVDSYVDPLARMP